MNKILLNGTNLVLKGTGQKTKSAWLVTNVLYVSHLKCNYYDRNDETNGTDWSKKNSPISNLAGTVLKKSRDTLFCILFSFYLEQLCRLESSTRLPLLTGKNNAKSMFR